jgi:hypothetical protein
MKSVYNAFVSMPFGSSTDGSDRYWNDFFNAIQDIVPLLQTRDFTINFHRADQTVGDLQLKESVKKQIQESNLVVAVITGLNPNVFWEVGYSHCLNLPIVFLVEANSQEARRCPVLINETLQFQYDGKIFDVVPQDDKKLGDFKRGLIPFLKTAVDTIKAKIAHPPRFYSDRNSVLLPKKVWDAKKSIDVITSNLSYFADIEKFYIEINGKKEFPFDEPIEKGVKVRILSLNPDSSIAEYRAKQLGLEYDVAGYREELRNSARFFYQRYEKHKNVEIWIYEDLPLQITFIIDDEVVTSIMSSANRSRDNIHCVFDGKYEGVGSSFKEHFSEVLANKSHTSHISHFAWAKITPENTVK